jgi:hypothetical protein
LLVLPLNYFYEYRLLSNDDFFINPAAAHEDVQMVAEEDEEKKRHLNVVFIGHVGKLVSYCPFFNTKSGGSKTCA